MERRAAARPFGIPADLELFLKFAALVLTAGILIGKLNSIDSRIERVERFLDTHVQIEGKP